MGKITKAAMKDVLASIVAILEKEKAYLIELDGSMGDGDLGLTMHTGFLALYNEMDAIHETDMGKVFMKLGMKMNSVVPSTMGTLIATCFIKASAVAKGKTELELHDLAAMGQAAIQGVMERGKSKVGDKTMLDALYPAIEALDKAMNEDKPAADLCKAVYYAAVDGVEQTKKMQSVHGRAAYYNEKSIGKPDPGATAVMFIIKGITNRFC
ncbi:dihydroxyacetone kinase subunit l [Lucifera butyrica]|uniref:phosphoenolpyruvate--glycerone phosphotransferase n=1 Tax=Lucifera butyrica TaxID=1351585 RepID=A0A498R9Y9_9FIRM|nr:dihydroxyacetone kinase subunit DhaL [Lucifera butyrica]VBB07760.1 dihydroxyacetone kinase subunit l [Lucifera butyrica]